MIAVMVLVSFEFTRCGYSSYARLMALLTYIPGTAMVHLVNDSHRTRIHASVDISWADISGISPDGNFWIVLGFVLISRRHCISVHAMICTAIPVSTYQVSGQVYVMPVLHCIPSTCAVRVCQ